MRKLVPLVLLALLAIPATAFAAATIGPRAASVSEAGATSVEIANPHRHVLTGRVSLTVAGRTVASRAVRLGRRSVSEVGLRLDARSLSALRSAGTQRATVIARLRRAGRRAGTVRRTLTLRAPSSGVPSPAAGVPAGAPAPAAAAPAGQAPAGGGTSGGAAAAPANRWVGRMGGEGAYNDLELTLADGQLRFTKAPLVPVVCFETGSGRTAVSGELFGAPGPWALGGDGQVAQEGVAVNALVGSSARTITSSVTGTTLTAGRIAGTLGISFHDSRYDVFAGKLFFVNCAGSQSFEAVPA